MEKGITISDYLKTKEISPQDLKDNFKFIKRYNIDMTNYDGCPHCKDRCNQYKYPSGAWANVIHCIACDSIIITYVSDRMGGNNMDVIEVFKQK